MRPTRSDLPVRSVAGQELHFGQSDRVSPDPALLWKIANEGEIDQLFSLVTIGDMAQAYLRDVRRTALAGVLLQ